MCCVAILMRVVVVPGCNIIALWGLWVKFCFQIMVSLFDLKGWQIIFSEAEGCIKASFFPLGFTLVFPLSSLCMDCFVIAELGVGVGSRRGSTPGA